MYFENNTKGLRPVEATGREAAAVFSYFSAKKRSGDIRGIGVVFVF